MTSSLETEERLSFLTRAVSKQIVTLEYADKQLFSPLLTLDMFKSLTKNPVLALKIDAFVVRFCRLQDTIDDQLLPAILRALEEPVSALLINLTKAESFGWLDSVDQWMKLRHLYSKMVPEYTEDVTTLCMSLMTAHESISVLKQFADTLIAQTERLKAS